MDFKTFVRSMTVNTQEKIVEDNTCYMIVNTFNNINKHHCFLPTKKTTKFNIILNDVLTCNLIHSIGKQLLIQYKILKNNTS